MAITTPCGLRGKVFTHNNRKYKVVNFSWNDAMYICEMVGTSFIKYFTPDQILLALMEDSYDYETAEAYYDLFC